jgi:anti-anti-sigma factor
VAQKMHITSHPWKGELIRVDIRGSLTAETVPLLDKEFAKRFSEGHFSFVVHLSQLTGLSFAGGTALLGQLRLAHERGGSVTLVQPSPEVEKVLGSLGVLPLLHIVRDTSELIGAGTTRKGAEPEKTR